MDRIKTYTNGITRTTHRADGFTLSTVRRGEYIKMRYIGYTVREAMSRFRTLLREKRQNNRSSQVS